jgi:hypothetical protein
MDGIRDCLTKLVAINEQIAHMLGQKTHPSARLFRKAMRAFYVCLDAKKILRDIEQVFVDEVPEYNQLLADVSDQYMLWSGCCDRFRAMSKHEKTSA